MSNPATLLDTRNAISSPELAYGPTPYVVPDGATAALFGQALAPANLSARQAKVVGLLTSGIYGQPGFTSSASANLASSLVNRLLVKTVLCGSTLFKLTWKRRDTPGGLSIYALRASALRTSGNDFGSWPSPLVNNIRGPQKGPNRQGPPCLGMVASWATPNCMDSLPIRSEDKLARAKSVAGCSNIKDQVPVFGIDANGSPVATENGAQLNPAHSRWLMGLRPEWDDCAPTETRSTRRPPKP